MKQFFDEEIQPELDYLDDILGTRTLEPGDIDQHGNRDEEYEKHQVATDKSIDTPIVDKPF